MTHAGAEMSHPDQGEIVSDMRRQRRRVHPLDFSAPTKFTAELRRRIGRVLNSFCDAVATRLSAELRTPVEMWVSDTNQLTWAAARAQLPTDSLAVGLEALPIERKMLLSIEQPLILRALECLLGGSASNVTATRHMSEVDWALTRGLLESMIPQFSLAWRDLGRLDIELRQVDLEGDAGVFAPIGEPTFSVTLQCTIDGPPASMSLLIPWIAIEPVTDEILGTANRIGGTNPDDGPAVRRGLAAARVPLRAEIGSVQMSVERVLALTPDTLLRLEERAEDGVRLYAEGVALGRGRPGRRGARRAVKLTSPMDPGGKHDPQAISAISGLTEPRRVPVAAQPRQALEALAILHDVPVRVWAELGRTSVPLGRALGLPQGSVVELDQEAQAPIDLFVNGLCFAHGDLVVMDGGEWAVRVSALA